MPIFKRCTRENKRTTRQIRAKIMLFLSYFGEIGLNRPSSVDIAIKERKIATKTEITCKYRNGKAELCLYGEFLPETLHTVLRQIIEVCLYMPA